MGVRVCVRVRVRVCVHAHESWNCLARSFHQCMAYTYLTYVYTHIYAHICTQDEGCGQDILPVLK